VFNFDADTADYSNLVASGTVFKTQKGLKLNSSTPLIYDPAHVDGINTTVAAAVLTEGDGLNFVAANIDCMPIGGGIPYVF
jgi:hypothetical protein